MTADYTLHSIFQLLEQKRWGVNHLFPLIDNTSFTTLLFYSGGFWWKTVRTNTCFSPLGSGLVCLFFRQPSGFNYTLVCFHISLSLHSDLFMYLRVRYGGANKPKSCCPIHPLSLYACCSWLFYTGHLFHVALSNQFHMPLKTINCVLVQALTCSMMVYLNVIGPFKWEGLSRTSRIWWRGQ